jgi:L-asparagine transporter-like permease
MDLGLLALALPVFVVADLPMLGYAVAAAAWIAQHLILAFAQRRAAQALQRGDRRLAMGAIGAATLGRVWLVTLAILLVGLLGEREDGLAAAVLSLALVTTHFLALGLTRLFYPEEGAE